VIDEKGTTTLHRIHGDGGIASAPADATKGLGVIGVRLGSHQFTVGRTAPEVGAAGIEEGAGEGAEGPDELVGIAALKSGAGKLQEELLESLLRVRRFARTRFSGVGCQRAPLILAKRLKTIELHSKRTLHSQIESREYEMAVPTCERHKGDTRVSIWNSGSRLIGQIG
jgi:hypothetical protein